MSQTSLGTEKVEQISPLFISHADMDKVRTHGSGIVQNSQVMGNSKTERLPASSHESIPSILARSEDEIIIKPESSTNVPEHH